MAKNFLKNCGKSVEKLAFFIALEKGGICLKINLFFIPKYVL